MYDNGYIPWLSVLTAGFELAVAAWALSGPGRRKVLLPMALLLIVLAGYQLIEVVVCAVPERIGLARLGFLDVAWLPPLGLWMVQACVAPDSLWHRRGVQLAFAVAAVLCAWVAVDPNFITGTVCTAVIATYSSAGGEQDIYGFFYEIGLFGIIFGGLRGAVGSDDPVLKRHVADLVAGTLGFVLPSFLTQLILKDLDPSLPSLMCHYALILGVMLAIAVRRERQHAG